MPSPLHPTRTYDRAQGPSHVFWFPPKPPVATPNFTATLFGGGTATTVDSYSETNNAGSTNQLIDGDAVNNGAVGQAFTATGVNIGSAVFYLKKIGSPTGTAVARLYATSGTFGTSAVPTGSVLATSDTFTVSTLTTTFALITFTFSAGNQYLMTNGTKYAVMLEYTAGSSGNSITIGTDQSSPTHAGNLCYHDGGGYGFVSGEDVCFYVYSTVSGGPAATLTKLPKKQFYVTQFFNNVLAWVRDPQVSGSTIQAGGFDGISESFTSIKNATLGSSTFTVAVGSTMGGTLFSKLYAVTGTPGVNAKPTGTALATSDALDSTTLSTGIRRIYFTFSGANQISLVAGTNYCVTIEKGTFPTSSGTCNVKITTSIVTHPGNGATLATGTWTDTTNDFQFGIFSTDTADLVTTFIPGGGGTLFTQSLTASLSFVGNFAKGLLYLRNFGATLFAQWGFTTGLVSYWKLDEASGTRNDSFGTNHLTDNNTVTSNTGIQGNAAQFQASSSEYLSCASNSSLQMSGNTSFTIAAWVTLSTLSHDASLVTKDSTVSRDYTLDFQSVSGFGFRFYINGGGAGATLANSSAGYTTGVWWFVVCWYDSSDGSCHIRVNDSVQGNSPTGATGATVGSSEFRIGARQYSGVEDYSDALIDEVAIWKRLLTPAEITALYNSGAGTTYGAGLATLTRLPKKSLVATLAPIAAIIRKITDAGFTATLSFIGAVIKNIRMGTLTRSLASITLSFSGNLAASKTFLRALTATLSFTGALTRRTGKALSATLTLTTAQVKRIVDSGFAATLSFVGAITKNVRKNLTAALSWIGNLATTYIAGGGHVFTQSLTASLSFVGLAVKLPRKAFSATLFPTGPPTDNFNRSDGSLGSNWISPVSAFSGASGVMQIFSNQAGCTVDDVHSYATWAGTFSDNQYSQIKITSIGAWTGVCVRYDSSVTRFYLAFVFAANDYRIYAYWDGAYNGLFFGTTETWVSGDTMRLEISGSVHPITATMYRNGASVGSWTSGSSAEVKTGGNPGIGMYSPAGLNLRLDDWQGGNLGGTSIASLTRKIGKALSAVQSFSVTLIKRIRDAGFAATQSFTGLLTTSKSFLKSLTATLSFTGSLATVVAHFFTRAFTATLSFTGAIRTRAQKAFAATLSFVSAQTKNIRRNLAAALSFVGDFVKLYIPPGPQTFFKSFAATLAPTAAQTKRIIDSGFTAALSFVGNLAAIKLFLRVFTATLSSAGTLSRSTRKALSAIFSTAASLVKRSTRTLSGTLSFAGSMVKAIRDAGFTATLSFAGNLVGIAVHFFTRAFTASLSFVGFLGIARRFGRVLAASLSFSGAIQRRISKVFSATAIFSTAARKAIRKGFAAVQSFAVFFFKGGAITVLAGWITKCLASIGISGSTANVVRAGSQLTVEKLDETGVQIQTTSSTLTVERTK